MGQDNVAGTAGPQVSPADDTELSVFREIERLARETGRVRLADMAQAEIDRLTDPEALPAERMRGRQWCDWGDHCFVPAFGHGDGELVWIDQENILVCNAHYAEACEEAEREAVD